jgi:hypothetical protein
VPFFFVFFCFCRFNKEKASKEIVTSPQKGKNWTIHQFEIRKQELDVAIMEAQLELLLEKTKNK